jgi:uridine kinase
MKPTLEKVAQIVRAKKEPGKPLIVFVCGMGGSGKTTFCKNLKRILGENCIGFHTDWYATYPTEERKARIKAALESKDQTRIEREENPKNWYSWTKLKEDLTSLKASGHLEIQNAWNQATGNKDLAIDLSAKDPSEMIILCDGIYLFHPSIIGSSDFVISLHVSQDELNRRASARDSHRSSQEYLDYKASLIEKYDIQYYKEYEKIADLIVDNEDIS